MAPEDVSLFGDLVTNIAVNVGTEGRRDVGTLFLTSDFRLLNHDDTH